MGKNNCRKDHAKAHALLAAGRRGGSGHKGITGTRDKGHNSGYILKTKTVGSVERIDVVCKKTSKSQE